VSKAMTEICVQRGIPLVLVYMFLITIIIHWRFNIMRDTLNIHWSTLWQT